MKKVKEKRILQNNDSLSQKHSQYIFTKYPANPAIYTQYPTNDTDGEDTKVKEKSTDGRKAEE